MQIDGFVRAMKDRAVNELLALADSGECIERHFEFSSGHADVTTITGGAIAKAVITSMLVRGVQIDADADEDMGLRYSEGHGSRSDAVVYQMEVFPENPHCPMGHFNTEWLTQGSGTYFMNLDLFPAVRIDEDLAQVKACMDQLADRFHVDRDAMRQGLDVHYNMAHWSTPLAAQAGCKLIGLKGEEVELFIAAYQTFFDAYLEILKLRKDTPYDDQERRLGEERNGKWLEYVTLKDDAIKSAQVSGLPAELIIALAFPPSAAFR